MKCARKYSDASSYVFRLSPYEVMLQSSDRNVSSHILGLRYGSDDALFPDFDTRFQFSFQQVRLQYCRLEALNFLDGRRRVVK